MIKSAQELFNRVATHLLTQNEQSMVREDGPGGAVYCKYRGPRGLKCAIGALIPDAAYRVQMEGERVTYDPIRVAAGIPEKLTAELQIVHDHNEPWRWPSMLAYVAREHDLDFITQPYFARQA